MQLTNLSKSLLALVVVALFAVAFGVVMIRQDSVEQRVSNLEAQNVATVSATIVPTVEPTATPSAIPTVYLKKVIKVTPIVQ